MIDAFYCINQFYTLESLQLLVSQNMEFGMKSHERLLEDIQEYRSVYTDKLIDAIYDYTALVVFGEMRHGLNQSTHYNPNIKQGGGRNGSYEKAKNYNPTTILRAGESLFSKDWGSSYGGERWKVIANRVQLKGSIDKYVYCDMCFSLSHNTSPYLNKSETNIFRIDSCMMYKHLLDLKFKSHDPNKIITECLEYISETVKRFIKRAMVLGLIDEIHSCYLRHKDVKAQRCEKLVFEYKGVEWGNEYLKNELVQHRKTICHGIRSMKDGKRITRKYGFKIGQRVVILRDCLDGNDNIEKGMIAKIIAIKSKISSSSTIGVQFERCIWGHTCHGKGMNNHCWWVTDEDIIDIDKYDFDRDSCREELDITEEDERDGKMEQLLSWEKYESATTLSYRVHRGIQFNLLRKSV